jgi:hypothetical protein
MDEITNVIQGKVPWYMIFADDIVLVGKNLVEVNNKLDEWRLVLEGKGFRIIRNKTEYIDFDFGGRYQEIGGMRRPITISGDVMDELENLKYLGSLIQRTMILACMLNIEWLG